MKQNEISIANKRSEHTGDNTQGHIRIVQNIEADDGTLFQVYTDRSSGKLVLYENKDDKIYSTGFVIKSTGGGVTIPDLVHTSTKRKKGENELSNIDDVSFGEADGSGQKSVRNNLVLPQDTMINDQGLTTTHSDLRARFQREFKVAEFSLQNQKEFVANVIASFGMNSEKPIATRRQ